ncbi:biotin transporter BioY [Falsirhodobacter sp. alg1]|uniref:biotin transporter BioY n=1 Tax=Falsirhodobacter sp. alg1 TaxID=1472418 RepID=UPI0005EFE94D|nr:biotin transporter BioY [Falsirhodobacter sp. alg1]
MERNVTLIALFAALIAALSTVPQIHLPLGIPITAQSLGIMLCGTVLGARRGALAVLLYLAVAAMGLPILAGGRGGLAPFVGPSAGFLLGFPVAAFVIGAIMRAWKGQVLLVSAFAGVIGGIVVLYACGIFGLWLYSPEETAMATIAASMAVFLPGDLIKVGLAALITQSLARARPHVLLSRN